MFGEKFDSLIEEYNTLYRANDFLFKDQKVENLLQDHYNVDRFRFLERMKDIETHLARIVSTFHGRKVIYREKFRTIKGTIHQFSDKSWADGPFFTQRAQFRTGEKGDNYLRIRITVDRGGNHNYAHPLHDEIIPDNS